MKEPQPLLQAWIEANGKSQAWLAREIGKSQSMVNKICRLQRTVSLPVAEQIAKLTGLPVDSIGRVFTPKGRKRDGKKDAAGPGDGFDG